MNDRPNPDRLVLLAHRCRGEIEFELAIEWQFGTPSDPGPWYILQACGARAYPFWLEEFKPPTLSQEVLEDAGRVRDFYQANTSLREPKLPAPRRAPLQVKDLL